MNNSNYDNLFEQLSNHQQAISEPKWLIYAETQNSVFTKSNIAGFEKYSPIYEYSENEIITNKQSSGEGGIVSSDLKITIPRNGISVEFYNKFINKTILTKIEIIELIMKTNNDKMTLSTRHSTIYKTCKINSHRNNMNKIDVTITYNSRTEKFFVNDSKGVNQGSYVSF